MSNVVQCPPPVGEAVAVAVAVAEAEAEAADFGVLWDRVEVCLGQSAGAATAIKALAGTLQSAGAIEEQHATQLALFRKRNSLFPSKPAVAAAAPVPVLGLGGRAGPRPSRTLKAESTLEACLSSFGCMYLDNVIKSRIVVAHEYTVLGGKLGAFRNEQKRDKKRLAGACSRLDKQRQSQELLLARSRAKYVKACKDAERAVEHRDKVTSLAAGNAHSGRQHQHQHQSQHQHHYHGAGPSSSSAPSSSSSSSSTPSLAEVTKACAKAREAVGAAKASEDLHVRAVAETRKAQRGFQGSKTQVARDLQALEESRVKKVKQVLERMARIQMEQAVYLNGLLRDFEAAVASVTVQGDSRAFVACHHAGSGMPAFALAEFRPYASDLLAREGAGFAKPSAINTATATATATAGPAEQPGFAPEAPEPASPSSRDSTMTSSSGLSPLSPSPLGSLRSLQGSLGSPSPTPAQSPSPSPSSSPSPSPSPNSHEPDAAKATRGSVAFPRALTLMPSIAPLAVVPPVAISAPLPEPEPQEARPQRDGQGHHRRVEGKHGESEAAEGHAGPTLASPPPPPARVRRSTKEKDLVTAMYSFEPLQDNMIRLRQGDILRVLQRDECGWWTCEKLEKPAPGAGTASVGLCPSNYLQGFGAAGNAAA